MNTGPTVCFKGPSTQGGRATSIKRRVWCSVCLSVSRQTGMQSKVMLSQRGCYAWSRKSPAEVLANNQLCDLEQVTPTSSLSFLISEVGLRPTPHHCYEYKISFHMLRSVNQTHDKCSRNAYICIRRFIHSFIKEIKRLGSRKELGPTLELTWYSF